MLVYRRADLFPRPVVPRPLLGRCWTAVDAIQEPVRPLEALVVNIPVGEIPPNATSLREIAELPGERRVAAAAAIASLLTKNDADYRAACVAEGSVLRVLGGVSKLPAPQAATFASAAGEASSVSFAVEAVENEAGSIVALRTWIMVFHAGHSLSKSAARWMKLRSAAKKVAGRKRHRQSGFCGAEEGIVDAAGFFKRIEYYERRLLSRVAEGRGDPAAMSLDLSGKEVDRGMRALHVLAPELTFALSARTLGAGLHQPSASQVDVGSYISADGMSWPAPHATFLLRANLGFFEAKLPASLLSRLHREGVEFD